MYSTKPAVVSASGAATLAYTGANTLFWIVAAFTIFMAGAALYRLTPKSER